MTRRTFLRWATVGGTSLAFPIWSAPAASGAGGSGVASRARIDPGTSRYGRWIVQDGLPAFAYDVDQDALPEAEWDPILAPKTRRHWVMIGNRALRIQAANDGGVGVFDESESLRWLVAPDPTGSGVSVLHDDGRTWGTAWAERGGERPPTRTFGPASFRIDDARDGLTLERTIVCPDGDVPWLLVRVRLRLARGARGARQLTHVERWALRPRFLNLIESDAQRRTRAAAGITYEVESTARGLRARERFAQPGDPGPAGEAAPFLHGTPATLVLETLGRTAGTAAARAGDEPFPVLEIETPVVLEPGGRRELWFRFGHDGGDVPSNPKAFLGASLRALAKRLPRATSKRAPEVRQEIPWHAALLTGGATVDRVIGETSLDQASTYSYVIGFNGAARDPLQHALPLVYVDPPLALSVLRNTCAWAMPDGDLPYALDGAKQPTNIIFRPSDQNLWTLWLAAEYAAATGDLAAFDAPLAYHPAHAAAAVPLGEHLRRQFRFFVDGIGRGARDHVRILNADWNDVAIADSGVDRDLMISQGSSVLNSAMAAWVLPVFAGLADRLGEPALAAEARAQGDELRALVASAWNGRWFHRAYAPGGNIVGNDDCWLEVQPWAILCGAATDEQARSLLATIDAGHRSGSPLGARLRWPLPQAAAGLGEGTLGGIWFSIQMTLIWAAARIAPEMAWDEWRRSTLASHSAAYPTVWEGTLSGPDAYNAPESARAGRTWGTPTIAMQAFPVNNLHAHAQPLLAYLRLLGVEPRPDGALAIGTGGEFRSQVLRLSANGRGRLRTQGAVVLETTRGTKRGGPGTVAF